VLFLAKVPRRGDAERVIKSECSRSVLRGFFFSCKRAGDEKSETRGEGMLAVLLGGGGGGGGAGIVCGR